MPYLIEEANFSRTLEIGNSNYASTKEILIKGAKEYKLTGLAVTPGYRFVQSRTGEEYRLIYKTAIGWYTLYAVKVELHAGITYPKTAVTQVMVWRAPSVIHKHILDSITQLFFINLLTRVKIVVSDAEQTVHGMRFWKRMLEWAFYTGYYIYLADGTKEEEWSKDPINSYDELCTIWESFIWGRDKDVHTHRRLIISKNDIKGKKD